MKELMEWLNSLPHGQREAQLARLALAADVTTSTLRRYAKGLREPRPRVRKIILNFIKKEEGKR